MTPNNTREEEHWKDTLNQLLQAVCKNEVGAFKDVEDWHNQELQEVRREVRSNLLGLVIRNCAGFTERGRNKFWALDMDSLERDIQDTTR